jgi:hypothetical protein
MFVRFVAFFGGIGHLSCYLSDATLLTGREML